MDKAQRSACKPIAEPRAAVAQLPHAPGVYRFRDRGNRVVYIGRASDLRRRVGSYWASDKRRVMQIVRRIARVEALSCDSEHEATWLERNLLERGLPPWNRTAGGQEVRVFIRAARSLAFELAAQVQLEIEAVEWVVSEQKVTVSDPHDAEVYGWSSGLLLHFEVRDGRLCSWRQRPCSESAARPRLAATPAAWSEFSRRNAELAARLASSRTV